MTILKWLDSGNSVSNSKLSVAKFTWNESALKLIGGRIVSFIHDGMSLHRRRAQPPALGNEAHDGDGPAWPAGGQVTGAAAWARLQVCK